LGKRSAFLLLAAAVLVGGWFASRALMTHRAAVLVIPSEAVATRDIALTVEATGTVQPVEIVEIKSKASGQILRMPVQLGSVVRAGELLAQIDTVTVQNQYNQSLAALHAAEADVEISGAQEQRADELYSREVLTADQHESATLAYANAQSALARARSDYEIARQSLNDATVRAPSAGTIIEQDVTKGQVIASATSSASGGTTLLKMADLNRVQMQALVGETDIGNVKAGQSATVTVDAFPNRPFSGQVVKIQPQAVVQQAVTMFPVLIAIANENGLLLPGMNGQVTVSIEQRTGVLAVPLDAVRTVRELSTVAAALGMNADSLRAQVQRQSAARATRWAGAHPDSARTRAGRGAGGAAATGAAGGSRRGAGSNVASTRGTAGGPAGGASNGGAGAGPSGASGAGGGTGSGTGSGRSARAQVVFVKTPQGFEPRLVRLGISDFDYAEVLGGLSEGDEVALLSVAEAQAKRQQDIARARQRAGTGMPGVTSSAGGGARSTGGGR
jgi:HlyD family secretion protein